jgi:hypothetical protein
MSRPSNSSPNPRRVAAGRRNWLKRGPLTPAGYEKLRQTALLNQPWRHSTGPRTPEGKARSLANTHKLKKGEKSVRQLRVAVSDIQSLIAQMARRRRLLKTGC